MARKSRYGTDPASTAISADIWLCGQYGRLSVEDGDDEEKNSIGNQRKICLDKLNEYSSIRLVEAYSDNGYTGMNYKRPDFVRMMEDLRAGVINCVIVKDISRLGRHFLMTSELVEKTLPEMEVRLICVNDDYDSLDANADASALMLPIKMVMNDSYVKDISKKIRSSIHAKMNSGEYLPSSGSIPYGYQRDPENQTFAVDQETAPVVSHIFEMRAKGMKFNAIAKKLNAESIPCPGKLRYLRGVTKADKYKDAEWLRGTVRKITGDQVYIGNRVHGRVKRDKLGADKMRRPAEEWQIIENAHDAIVSRELFLAVQEVNRAELERISSYEKCPEVGADYRDLFRGKSICADCGAVMLSSKGCARVNAKTPSRVFFDCGNYKNSSHARCTSHYIRQETLMEAVMSVLNQQIAVCVDVEKFAADVRRAPSVVRYQSAAQERMGSVRQRRFHLDARLEQLLVDLTNGLIDRKEYEYAKKRYEERYECLQREENEAAVRLAELDTALNATWRWVEAIKNYQRLPELNRELLDVLVKDIVVFSSREVKVNLSFADPYAPMTNYMRHVSEVMDDAG